MALIKSITVSIRANTQKFVRGVKRAQRGLQGLSKTVSNVGMKIAKMATIMGTVAAGALGLFVKQSYGTIDSLAKTADKLGVTTEALGGFHHAAGLAGVQLRTFNMGLQRMIRRVAEASIGTGEAKAALLELRLDAQKLAQLSPDKQFLAVARAMQEVGSQNQRIRLAMRLFDSEGVALVNILNKGEKAIRAAMQEAVAFGTAISRVDAAKIEAANDALRRSRAATQGLINQIAVRLAPWVEAIATGMSNWLKDTLGNIDPVKVAFEGLAETIAVIADTAVTAYSKVDMWMTKLRHSTGTYRKAAKNIWEGFWEGVKTGEPRKAGEAVAEKNRKLFETSAKAWRIYENYFSRVGDKDTYNKVLGFFDQINDKAATAAKKSAEFSAALRDIGPLAAPQVFDLSKLNISAVEQFAQRWRQIVDFGKEMKDFAKTLASDMRTPLERFRDFVEQVRTAFQLGFIDQTVFSRAIKRAKDTLETDLRAEITQEGKGDEQKGLFGVINERLMSLDVLRQRKQVQEVRDPVNEKIHKAIQEMHKDMTAEERIAVAG